MGKIFAVAVTTATILAAGCALPVRQAVIADLDGDGVSETVRLEKRKNELVVTFSGGSLAEKSQVLSFGIDSARQDAVCGWPAQLEVSRSDCAPEALGSELLEGCSATAHSQDVALADGMCDSIYMYWNREKQMIEWWRL